MQNLVVLMEPSEHADDIAIKGGNMLLNRFCIDEYAAFELSGVNRLKKTSRALKLGNSEKRKVKGREYSFVRSFSTFTVGNYTKWHLFRQRSFFMR